MLSKLCFVVIVDVLDVRSKNPPCQFSNLDMLSMRKGFPYSHVSLVEVKSDTVRGFSSCHATSSNENLPILSPRTALHFSLSISIVFPSRPELHFFVLGVQ